VTLEQLRAWLDEYGRAWEARNPDGFLHLFASDAVYAWGPFVEPLVGHDEIGARLRAALAEQDEARFGHEPLAVTPEGRGLSRWWASIRTEERGVLEENEGVFLVALGPDRRCTEFQEWWSTRSSTLGS